MKSRTILATLLLVPSGAFVVQRQPHSGKAPPLSPPFAVSTSASKKRANRIFHQRDVIKSVQSATRSFNIFNRISRGTNTTKTFREVSKRKQSGIKPNGAASNGVARVLQGIVELLSQTWRKLAGSLSVLTWISAGSNQTATLVDDFVESLPKVVLAADRRALPAQGTDLSGRWKPIVTPEFRGLYNVYLAHCGESMIKRNLYSNVVALTRECITQDGKDFEITGTSPVGSWKRKLIGSEASNPILASFPDPDNDVVTVEAWWEQQGTVHESWLRGKPRVYGGEFQTKRYLESENVLICESWFHPNPTDTSGRFKPGYVKWRFEREQ